MSGVEDTSEDHDEHGNAVPTQDFRGAPRFTLLLRVAKLIAPEGKYLCIVRDASCSGIRTQIFHALPPASDYTLELQSDQRHPITRVWEHDSHAGFRFKAPIDINALLSDSGEYPKRPIRLSMQVPALISASMQTAHATICDLSQHGARIISQAHLAIDQAVHLEAVSFPRVRAHVRWRKNREYGLIFEGAFNLEALACLAAHLQKRVS